MPITINSPYSGKPVKVRDADIERAIRDEEGRVFYVVKRADGDGYYAALTRKGSAKDEARYDAMASKMGMSEAQAKAQQAAVFDATGRRRANPVLRLIVLLIVLAALAAGVYVFLFEGDVTSIPLPSNPLDTPVTPTDPLDLPSPTPPTPQVHLRMEYRLEVVARWIVTDTLLA